MRFRVSALLLAGVTLFGGISSWSDESSDCVSSCVNPSDSGQCAACCPAAGSCKLCCDSFGESIKDRCLEYCAVKFPSSMDPVDPPEPL